ncbi:Flagellar hook-associated protein 2 [Paraconexibacter sp. AEG42_29]|uniref:Flagellar hook-associated protein 2 n=1 Tax=Paraconexibacter sp. AEG42_29 TaxID=2997339 RepID=A0AAU7ANJ7_9ACTN
MAGVQLTGLASGMDTDAIVKQLLAAESTSRTNLVLKQAATQARSDALKDVAAKLSSLKTAATALRSAGTWADVQTIESADSTKVAARTIAGAASGGHTVTVSGLARAAQSTFDYAVPGAAGSITVNGHDVALASGASLDDAVSAINSDEDAGVYAVNVGGRLAISSKTTGAASAATATGSMVSNGTTLAGADSAFTVDGVAYTRSTNVVTDALAGVELTLKGASTGTAVTVSTPGASPESIVNAAKGFVTAYNAVVDAIRQQTTEKRIPTAATTGDARKGSLFNDGGLNSVLSSLRLAISSAVPGVSSSLDQLSELGITTGTSTGGGTLNQDSIAGKLTLDTAVLRTKLDSDPSGVKKLLGGAAGTSGFAQKLEGVLEPLTQAGGVFAERTSSVASSLTSIAGSLTRFDERLASRETQLRRQFAALEVALQRNQDTLAKVTAQFA